MTQSDFTIDYLYTQEIEKLNKDENSKIPTMEDEINEIENNIQCVFDEYDFEQSINNKNFEEYASYLEEDDRIYVEEQLAKILKMKKKISKIKSKKTKYLLNNSGDLFKYFEIKQNIDKNNNPRKMISKFFNLHENKEERKEKTNNFNKCIQNYVRKNNFEYLNMNEFFYDKNRCTKCNDGELIKASHEGILICNKCFSSFKYLIDNDKPSYKEPPKEISFYAYKRINHFREILSQFQAKESTDIPDEIINHIKSQVKKERIELKNLNNKKTKEILKKLGYNKYYEHIPFIKDKLGIKPPVMTPHLEESLCNLFMDIQIPYAKYCPNDRVNFLNYYYTLYKLCELLGETQYLKYFPMLKEQKKIEQDDIWKKICNELGWDFIPTL